MHAYDPDPARAAEALARSASTPADGGATRRPHYAAFEGDLGVRDGAFDVVVIPDLSLFKDAGDVLRRARRLVPSSGAVVAASPNLEVKSGLVRSGGSSPAEGGKGRAGLTYYELFDVVSLQFSVVRMIGQAPFVGYTVADFALSAEPSVNIDTSLLSATEQPEWFIAVGSDRPVELEEFSLIELPVEELGLAGLADAARADAADGEIAAEDRLALIEARARIALMTTELESTRERQRTDLREIEAREKATAALSARVVELSAELEAKEARFKEIQGRAGDSHVRAERLTHQITDLEEEVRRQRDRATKLAKQLDDEKKGRTKAEMDLAMIRNKPEIAGAKDRLAELSAEIEAARARGGELEVELSAARLRGGELETELTAARARSGELEVARDVERARTAEMEAESSSVRRLLAEAAEKTAKRTAEIEARIADLERQNGELRATNEELSKRAGELMRAQDESASAVGKDLEAAETLLRERGRLIASLERDLRESERIGRELIEELSDLRDVVPAPSSQREQMPVVTSAPASPPTALDRDVVNDLRARLTALAERSARSEADLQAAHWRVAQLERDLADASLAAQGPSVAVAQLEQALATARAEIASLRQEPPRGAVEQSVLLNQVAGELAAGR